jgi:diacylglycerol kinase family enzyme
LTNEKLGRKPIRPIFLHNTTSGPALFRWRHPRIANLFRNLFPKGIHIPIDPTTSGEWRKDFHAAISSGCDYLYVGGGDGTINRLLPDLLDANLPVGVLPIGTGNLFSRYVLGIKRPSDLLKNPENYLTRSFTPGISDGHPFVLMVGTGLDGEAIYHQSRRGKYWLGKFSYPLEMFFSLLSTPLSRLSVEYEDMEGVFHQKTALWAIVARSPSYFPPFTINPGWNPWQKNLSVTLIEGRSKMDLWIALAEILAGKIPSRRITFEKAHSVGIRGDGRSQADGEEISVPALITISGRSVLFSIHPKTAST